MLPEYDLTGKVAIVTGAGRGIGKGIALVLAEAGADMVVISRTEKEVNKTAEEVRQLGRRALAAPTDITSEESVQKMVDKTLAEFGKIDILVNNAGSVAAIRPIVPLPHMKTAPHGFQYDLNQAMSLQEWKKDFEVDLHGAFLCARAVGPHMIKQGHGKIINITSAHGRGSFNYNIPMCSSKAAKNRFTETLAKEWARYGINVNGIGPGLVRTEMTEEWVYSKPDVLEKTLRPIPMRRAATTREIGLAAVYLASAASDYMTGQILYVDGGLTPG